MASNKSDGEGPKAFFSVFAVAGPYPHTHGYLIPFWIDSGFHPGFIPDSPEFNSGNPWNRIAENGKLQGTHKNLNSQFLSSYQAQPRPFSPHPSIQATSLSAMCDL